MVSAVLLDLDGTLFRGKTAIPGAEQALEKIRSMGISVFFLTNASTRTRQGVVDKLKGMGLHARKEEMFNSGFATADYIASKHPGKTVFCLSEGGVQDELREKGIEVVENENADIVVVGLDRKLNYENLSIAFRAIWKGALFLATNDDATFPTENGLYPGSGAMVAAVEKSTGKKPLIIGKPYKYGIELLLREHKIKKSEAMIVGDRIETDILAGKKNGLKSVLVLTGVTTEKDLEGLKKEEKPDYVISTIAELPKLLATLA